LLNSRLGPIKLRFWREYWLGKLVYDSAGLIIGSLSSLSLEILLDYCTLGYSHISLLLIKRSSGQRKVYHNMLALLCLCHHLPLHHIKCAFEVFAQSTIHASPRILKHPLFLFVIDYGCFLPFSRLHGPLECVLLPLNDHAVIRHLVLHPLYLHIGCSRLSIDPLVRAVVLRYR
jgi:hypothetical protein